MSSALRRGRTLDPRAVAETGMDDTEVMFRLAAWRCRQAEALLDKAIEELQQAITLLDKGLCGLAVARTDAEAMEPSAAYGEAA